MKGKNTFLERLEFNIQNNPYEEIICFLQDVTNVKSVLTYKKIYEKCKKVAGKLQEISNKGDRVILLLDECPSYVIGFLGCMYSGNIVVPVHLNCKNDDIISSDVLNIINRCEANIILTDSNTYESVSDEYKEEFVWINMDNIDKCKEYEEVEILDDDIAYIQYTSGSTSDPKGVMITYANIAEQCEIYYRCCKYDNNSKTFAWLPLIYDWGLIDGIFSPIYNVYKSYIMKRDTVIKDPLKWLQVIDRYRITHTPALNFILESCCETISEEEKKCLNLEDCKCILLGGERIKSEVVDKFLREFSECKINENTIGSAYGMAESTLIICATSKEKLNRCRLNKDALEQGKVEETLESKFAEIISCGELDKSVNVKIMNPDTLEPCLSNEIGEVWIAGKTVCNGYFGDSKNSKEVFENYYGNDKNNKFLRTGDLGFVKDNNLYVTGRLKDVIIRDGKNYYSQDIENTIEQSVEILKCGNGCVVSIEDDRIILIYEVSEEEINSLNLENTFYKIKKDVLENNGVVINEINLVKKGTICRTVSGKIQRNKCKKLFLDKKLKVLKVYGDMKGNKENKILSIISKYSKIDKENIRYEDSFDLLGIGSRETIQMVGSLERELDIHIPVTLVYSLSTIGEFIDYIKNNNERQEISTVSTEKLENKDDSDDIAIIGMDCRFPGARDVDEFWKVLRDGIDCIGEVPEDRWSNELLFSKDIYEEGKTYCKYGGFIEKVDEFDNKLFNIPKSESIHMDPQQRMLLELSWSGLEKAGYNPKSLIGKNVGVFVGCSSQDYKLMQGSDINTISEYYVTGNLASVGAGRLSYELGLNGPSLSVDSACSSSLLSVHLACKSIKNNESDMAIAGGVNLILDPGVTVGLSKAQMLSKTGKCHTFDAKADGYVRGEGSGVVILKKLSSAIRDNDNILAVIKGSAVDNDGKSNGLTAPNKMAQKKVILKALEDAKIDKNQISYWEAHGTGTVLGDPIEVEALSEALGKDRIESSMLTIGSVKTNIGHLEAAAGIASLIKVVLSLKNKYIPKSLNFNEPNSYIDWDNMNLEVASYLKKWRAKDKRIAGISSFGIGGTNVEMILEEYTDKNVKDNIDTKDYKKILKLSAASSKSVESIAYKYFNYLKENEGVDLGEFCYTANVARADLEYRAAVNFNDSSDLINKLENLSSINKVKNNETKLGFVFSGQGSQYLGMGKELYEKNIYFKKYVDECSLYLEKRNILSQDVIENYFLGNDNSKNIDNSTFRQVIIFILQYAIVKIFEVNGIKPYWVLGHSIGEYVAACTAGSMDWLECLEFIAKRGTLIDNCSKKGKMLSLLLSAKEVEQIIKENNLDIEIALINSTSNTVVAGEESKLEILKNIVEEKDIKTKYLLIDNAFHSSYMDEVLDDFESLVKTLSIKETNIKYISGSTGEVFEKGTLLDYKYWKKHLREKVHFTKAIESILKEKCKTLIEIGPNMSTINLINRTLNENSINYLVPISKKINSVDSFNDVLSKLYVIGCNIVWGEDTERRIDIPTYCFDRERLWDEAVEKFQAKYKKPVKENKIASDMSNDVIVNKEAETVEKSTNLKEYLINTVSSYLMLSKELINSKDKLAALGFDSLMAMRLRNDIKKNFDLDIKLKTILLESSIDSLYEEISKVVGEFNTDTTNITTVKEVEEKDNTVYPLSASQRELWILQQMDSDTVAYNLPIGIKFNGRLNLDVLNKSINIFMNRHKMFRCRFVSSGDEIGQAFDNTPSDIEVIDLSNIPSQEVQKEIDKIKLEKAKKKIDLANGTSFNISVIKVNEEENILLLIMHHIVADGWSIVRIFINELKIIYNALLSGEDYKLPTLEKTYVDFVIEQQNLIETESESNNKYWIEKFKDANLDPYFEGDKKRKKYTQYLGERRHYKLSKDIVDKIKKVAKKKNVTLFNVLLSAMNLLVYRWTGRSDVILGTTFSNRNNIEFENVFGNFTNNIPLRVKISEEESLSTLFDSVRDDFVESFEHAEYPFERIVEAVKPERQGNRNPMFNISFVMHTYLEKYKNFNFSNEVNIEFTEPVAQIDNETSELDMIFELLENEEGLYIDCEYDSEIFNNITIDRIIKTYENILKVISENKDYKVNEIEVVSEEDKQDILNKFNNNDKYYPKEKCLHEIFEEKVKDTPESIAVVCGDKKLTYKELDCYSNYMANTLLNNNIGRGDVVGICTDRSVHMIVAILSILKTGAAYIALDPKYPKDRLNYIVNDSDVKIVVKEKGIEDDVIEKKDLKFIDIDIDIDCSNDQCKLLKQTVYPDDTAYVLYTSGSTGNPKGALISHYNVVRLFQSTEYYYKFTNEDVWTFFHSYAFDFSVWELWGALLYGGKLVIVPYMISRSPKQFHQLLIDEKVTVLNQTPSAFRQLVNIDIEQDEKLNLRYVIFGGEALKKSILEPWVRKYGFDSPKLVNMYGITETTVHVTLGVVENFDDVEDDRIPVGKPLDDLQVYILDENKMLLPIGAVGEMYVGGGGVSKGYLNRPELTKERFVENPYSKNDNKIMYKSGDLARYKENGDLDYIGRIDEQVKVNGFRVELGEIESTIKECSEVKDCIVQLRKVNSDDNRIIAYVIPKDDDSDKEVDEERVSQWQSVFDATYSNKKDDEVDDPTLNITGWNSSYTGKPIAKEHMVKWVDYTINSIKKIPHKKVMEIACGTGMILFKIAPETEYYLGSDFSTVAIDYIKEQLKSDAYNMPQVDLLARAADNFEGIQERYFDLVIINSVTQCFPSAEYLVDVLEKAVNSVKDGGHIFVGDSRNFNLLDVFHGSVEFFKAKENEDRLYLQSHLHHAINAESELLISPEFFYVLKKRCPRISDVEIRLKRGREENEMVPFRFDVVLYIEKDSSNDNYDINNYDWYKDEINKEKVESLLKEDISNVAIRNIPNKMLVRNVKLLDSIRNGQSSETKKEITKYLDDLNLEGFYAEDFYELGESYGYNVSVMWNGKESGEYFDVVFQNPKSKPLATRLLNQEIVVKDDFKYYANVPHKGEDIDKIVPEIRDYVKERVPYYMVPANFIVMNEFPLTTNGKLDKKALPLPNYEITQVSTEFVEPRNAIEEVLVQIVCDILEFDKVGVRDNFFELGGNSILATKFATRIKENLGIEIQLRDIFSFPTIEEIAEKVMELLTMAIEDVDSSLV